MGRKTVSFSSWCELVWIVWGDYLLPRLWWLDPSGYFVGEVADLEQPFLLCTILHACNSGDSIWETFWRVGGVFGVGGCDVAWDSGHWGRVVGWVDEAGWDGMLGLMKKY